MVGKWLLLNSGWQFVVKEQRSQGYPKYIPVKGELRSYHEFSDEIVVS